LNPIDHDILNVFMSTIGVDLFSLLS